MAEGRERQGLIHRSTVVNEEVETDPSKYGSRRKGRQREPRRKCGKPYTIRDHVSIWYEPNRTGDGRECTEEMGGKEPEITGAVDRGCIPAAGTRRRR